MDPVGLQRKGVPGEPVSLQLRVLGPFQATYVYDWMIWAIVEESPTAADIMAEFRESECGMGSFEEEVPHFHSTIKQYYEASALEVGMGRKLFEN